MRKEIGPEASPLYAKVYAYAKTHPFVHGGDYARAAKELGMEPNTVREYAHRMGLNRDMPGPSRGDALKKVTITERVRKLITAHRMDVVALADELDVSPHTVVEAISALREQAATIDEDEGGFAILHDIRPKEPVQESLEELGERQGRFLIGITADWHVGSKYCREDVIRGLYEWYRKEGVTTVYLAGNWIDGEANFNTFDLETHGMSAQVQRFLELCPSVQGMTTKVLSGDDHEGWYVQREGIDIGQYLQMAATKAGRSDILDIGYMERDIELAPTQVLRVIHAGGGSAYATSYVAQKYAESLQGGEKPRIVAMGHYHKLSYEYPREIFMVQPGCAQDQTPFMRKKKLQAHVGGCILDVRLNSDGIIDEVGCRFKTWFDRKFYEYKW